MPPVRRAAVAAFLFGVLISPASHEAAGQQSGQPIFQSTIRLVRLNVSVLDKSRVPVRGLGREDFTVRIDGVVQPIAEIVEIDKGAARGSAAGSETPGVTTNDRRERRAFVLILDDANTHNDAQMMADVKKAARTFVDGLTERDLVAVVFTWNGRHNQDFTTDSRRVLRAVEQFRPGPGELDRRRNPVSAELALFSTVRNAVSKLREVPDVRTAVVLLSPGPKRLTSKQGLGELQSDEAQEGGFELMDGLVHGSALREASYALVPVFAISTWGLRPPGPIDPVFRYDPLMRGIQRGQDYLHVIANHTGGRAFTDTNDVAGAARQILLENESHYLVGYYPTYPVQDGRFRRLQVDVARDGVEVIPSDRMVRAPSGQPAGFKPSPRAALAGLLPADEFPLRLQTHAGTLENRRATVTMTVGINAPPPSDAAAIECVLFDPGGLKEVASARAEAVLTGAGWQDVRLNLTAPRGSYVVRCGVHLRGSGRMAGVYGDVDLNK